MLNGTRTARWVALGALALTLFACSLPPTVSGALIDEVRDSRSYSDVVTDAIDDVLAFRAAVSAYQTTEDSDPPFVNTQPRLDEWLYETNATLGNLELLHAAMAESVARVDSESLTGEFERAAGPTFDEVVEFVDASGAWVAANREQYEMAHTCLDLLPDRERVAACYIAGFAVNGERWDEIAERATAANKMFTRN